MFENGRFSKGGKRVGKPVKINFAINRHNSAFFLHVYYFSGGA